MVVDFLAIKAVTRVHWFPQYLVEVDFLAIKAVTRVHWFPQYLVEVDFLAIKAVKKLHWVLMDHKNYLTLLDYNLSLLKWYHPHKTHFPLVRRLKQKMAQSSPLQPSRRKWLDPVWMPIHLLLDYPHLFSTSKQHWIFKEKKQHHPWFQVLRNSRIVESFLRTVNNKLQISED